jgi:hypothetical protein
MNDKLFNRYTTATFWVSTMRCCSSSVHSSIMISSSFHFFSHDQDLMMVSLPFLGRLKSLTRLQTLFALIPDKGTLSRYATYFGKTAAALIRDKST